MSFQPPAGWSFGDSACGIRGDDGARRDIALAVSDRPCTAAGMFTTNQVQAAPVRLCRDRIRARAGTGFRGVVACSGNANACTGKRGEADALAMAAEAAGACRVADPESFLVASTGVIGRLLPMEVVGRGIRAAAGALSTGYGALDGAARAIMTTDTRPKLAHRSVKTSTGALTVAGIAKGAAMIGPNMATMLAFAFTDAAVAPRDLASALGPAIDQSFHCVSVDGHTSTNDTVLVLANGAAMPAGAAPLAGADLGLWGEALGEVCADLARAIAADAEGASHLLVVKVEGARTGAEARAMAKAVADSPLVKTAVFGADPNWGRVVSAAGYAGVPFEERDLSLWLDGFCLYLKGEPQPFDAAEVSAHMRNNRELTFRLAFTLGRAGCVFNTCDLTHEYVSLNADYTT
ncbi:MAG: bifunctional glutamate N-acetyltransferase/amino-acid acetyltransferase ArgJ [Planctomycetota bacterium]